MDIKLALLTKNEMDIDWTNEEGEPSNTVILRKSEVYGLLKAQCSKTHTYIKLQLKKSAMGKDRYPNSNRFYYMIPSELID